MEKVWWNTPKASQGNEDDDGTISEVSTVRMRPGTAAVISRSPYGAAERPGPLVDTWRMGRVNILSMTPPPHHPLQEENRRLRARNLQLTRFLADRQHEIPGASDVLHMHW